MKAMERIGALVGIFGWAMAIIYGLWTSASQPDGWEPVGVVGLLLGGLLGWMLAWYLHITYKTLPPPPEDDPTASIDEIQGDYGFFSPYSWWPLWLAAAAALMFLGLAVGWWVFFIGLFVGVPALIGWTFEYWKGPHAL
ncbi:MAG: cytochrome c oxidase subunit 4 [Phycicoccus sp.]|mgnify:CR=1 FL=1|nr:cytochrome c oxidase subunit 4 [Phycicoccus sp.]